MLERILLFVFVAAGSVVGVLCFTYLAVIVLRLLVFAFFMTGDLFAQMSHVLMGSFAEARLLRDERRERRWYDSAIGRDRAGRRPGRDLRRRSERTRQAHNAFRLLGDHASACCNAQCLMAAARRMSHMSALREEPECTAHRLKMARLIDLTAEKLNTEEVLMDPGLSANGVVLSIVRGMCGDQCHMLSHSREDAPRVCQPAQLLSHDPRQAHDPS